MNHDPAHSQATLEEGKEKKKKGKEKRELFSVLPSSGIRKRKEEEKGGKTDPSPLEVEMDIEEMSPADRSHLLVR